MFSNDYLIKRALRRLPRGRLSAYWHQRESLEHIATASQLLSRYIDEAAILSKPTPLKLEPVVLTRLFQSLELPEGIRFAWEFPRHASVLADRERIERLVDD